MKKELRGDASNAVDSSLLQDAEEKSRLEGSVPSFKGVERMGAPMSLTQCL